MTFAETRPILDQLGYTVRYVQLPGEQLHEPPVEGALRITPAQDDAGAAGSGDFALEVVDYGTARRLATARGEADAVEMLRRFLNRPFPAPRDIPRHELDGLRDRAATTYPQLAQQVAQAGDEGLRIQVPAGVPVDRVGGPDGYLLHPLDTPLPQRSLPPHVAAAPEVHRYVVERPFLVEVRFVQPWFDQPGGALRFATADPSVTVRDLVVDGSLVRLRVV
ncbi:MULTISPECIES: TNT domain-containing protein [unclassified Curtobacterium]|uniref:TNT domain-containing protein n=1 Tax=unclassified Curtobacterium TaxID=257496 RepID=UPI0008243180|nr:MULTISPECIES: TNT domain-containing protein [unclassified Curtobacterium]WIA95693.1 TNT domain-containing protein [Curtobacterium sp. MCBA15_004]WIA99057.1 TNT domain-containing protein [Curtobacterium sp. MCBA15_012]